MGVDEVLDDATVRTPHIDIDRARVAIDERSRGRTRRRASLVGAGGVFAVVVAVAVIALVRPDGDDTLAVVTDGTTGDPPTTAVDVESGWELMSDAPISPRVGHVAVSTGEEMVVWGGYTYESGGRRVLDDGAAYSFETGEWRTISSAPISGRGDAVVAWTGEEVVVLGGLGDDGAPLLDVAAWDPATDEWRRVPAPELAAASGRTGAAWTGEELILVGAARSPVEASNLTEVLALDVATGALRELDAVPPPDGPAGATDRRTDEPRRHAAVWTGVEVLVATIADGQPVTIESLDPDSGTWGTTVETPIPGVEVDPRSVAWTGDALVIENHLGPGAIYQPGSTNPVAEIPASESRSGFPAAVVGVDVVSVGDRWLDLRSLTWHDAEAIPDPQREFVSAIAEGGRYFVWGGDACGPVASCVGLTDPGPGLVWTPPASRNGEDDGDASTAQPQAAAVLGDAQITISAEPIELPGLTVEVGPPATRENGWFGHELRLTNTSDRTVRIDDNKDSRFLGQPPAILIAEPYCGYSGSPADPDAPVGDGLCRNILLEYTVEPGETFVQDWWSARDLPGLVPGGYGTFHYEKTFEYSVGGGDSPMEQRTEVVTITYEIVEVSP